MCHSYISNKKSFHAIQLEMYVMWFKITSGFELENFFLKPD